MDIIENKILPQPMSYDKFNIYYEKMHSGDKEARKKIIEHNLRFVVYKAKKFQNLGFELEELISIGTIGLIKSVDSYDISKNTLFLAYAQRCIENEILQFLNKNKKYSNDISMDSSFYIDSNGNMLKYEDMIEDQKEDFMLRYEKKEIYSIVRKIVSSLDEKSSTIIKLRFGLGTEDRIYSQEEVAFLLGVSQSTISNLEKKILKQLKYKMKKRQITECFIEKNSLLRIKTMRRKD